MLKQGVVIIAIGHPYYGRMAFNLAKTIKATDADCPIQLITAGNALNHLRKEEIDLVFDVITDTHITNGFNCKLHCNELSFFEQTLLIDADCVWVNKQSPLQLINSFKQTEFTGITEGFYNVQNPEKSDMHKQYYFWADVNEIVETYDLKNNIYQWRSEFMYFKRCENVDTLFAIARKIYDEATSKLPSIKLFAGHVPDELAINIAASICNMSPHQYKWQPSFWHRIHYENVPQLDAIRSKYYVLSCGSNVNSSNIKRIYDMIVKAASYKLGMQHMFQLISKREMMPDRQKM